jgi:predicted CoA-binding protein
MNSKKIVEEFLNKRNVALVGLSRKGNQFSNSVCKELVKKGYNVIPINPSAEEIGGVKCYPDLKSAKELVESALVMTPAAQVGTVIEDAEESGVKHIWIQQGADSEEAAKLGREKGLNVVNGECIMMFAEPVGFMHRIHRWFWRRLGKLPQ